MTLTASSLTRTVETATTPDGTMLYAWGAARWHYLPPPDVFLTGYGNRPFARFRSSVAAIRPLAPFVVDVRFHPCSHDRPEWNAAELHATLGSRFYCHCVTLGNPNHVDPRKPLAIYSPDAGLKAVRELIAAGRTPVLFCACGSSATCHRSLIRDLLKKGGLSARELEWSDK